ncbi:MAG: helicase HerA-like domain-containing protein [Chloroflexota bacterium]
MSKQQSDEGFWLALGLVLVVLAMLLTPAVVAGYLAYTVFRYVVAPHWGTGWFAVAAGVAGAVQVAVLTVPGMVETYFSAWGMAARGLVKQNAAGIEWWPLLIPTPAGVAAGVLVARWKAKSQLGEGKVAVKEGPSWREKRALVAINRAAHPGGGVLLGVEKGNGKRVVLVDAELNQHLFLVGTTGSGKTTTVMNFVESAAQRGVPLVLVDGKGDPGLAARVRALAERNNREFRHFAMAGPSARYNPLAAGGITELKDKLLHLTEWSEMHYEALAGRYLQLMFRVFELAGTRADLAAVARYLDLKRLEALAKREIKDKVKLQEVFDVSHSYQGGEIQGLAARLAALTESEIGHLFATDEDGGAIDLERVIGGGGVAVFSLDSLAFPEYSRLLGRLIIADLKCAAARSYKREKRYVYAIFDEFSVFASRAVVDLIGKARGAGFCTVIATQSLSDIEAAAGEAVVEQIVDNCNTFIVQRQNSAKSAEMLAGIIGTRENIEITQQVEYLIPGLKTTTSGKMGTRRQVREYLVHPDEVKRLKTGEAVVVRKTNFQVARVGIRNPGGQSKRNGSPLRWPCWRPGGLR